MKKESLHQAKFDVSPRASAARKHCESFWIIPDKGDFRDVINYLVPPPASPANLVALFDGRAKYGAIQNWRAGHKAPAWAVDLAISKMNARLNALYKAADEAIKRSPQWIGADKHAKGAAGAKALAAWRERKARERNEQMEKEKAACEQAALNQQPD